MKKTTIQTIIDLVLISSYIIFFTFFNKYLIQKDLLVSACVAGFLVVVMIICFSKFLLFKRQNFLFFAVLFAIYLVLSIVFFYDIEVLFKQEYGLLVISPGLVAMAFFVKYKDKYLIRLAVFLVIAGLILLNI